MGEQTAGTCRRGRVKGHRLFRILLLLFLFSPNPLQAMEVSLLAGATVPDHGEESTYGWQFDARYNLPGPLSFSASWINEGHLAGHRRDGPAARFWLRPPLPWNRVSLALGAGTYWYFDTQTRESGDHVNVHGWAPVYSLTASYYTETPWFFRLSANHIHPGEEIDTNVFLFGLGYRLFEETAKKSQDPASAPVPSSPEKTGLEVIPLLGVTIHNSLESQRGFAGGIEFRCGISEHFDFTLSWIREDNREEIRRNGIGTQIWLVDAFLARRLVLGIGTGLYAFHDSKPPEGGDSHTDLAGLVTLTAGYRFAEHWIGRFHWIRVMTDNHRDSDLFVVGAGYRWNP